MASIWRGTSTNSPIYLPLHHRLEILTAADQWDLALSPLYYSKFSKALDSNIDLLDIRSRYFLCPQMLLL